MKALYEPGLQFYVDKITGGEPFTFVRYGDADWSTITEHEQECVLCDLVHHLDLPGLREGMVRSIADAPKTDSYILATRTGVRKAGTVQYFAFLQWLYAHRLGEIDWHECNVFALAARDGKLWPFVQAIRDLDVPRVVIGPEWLQPVDRLFPVERFVSIPEVDCWLEIDRILDGCLDVPGPAFYSISAGVAAKWLAWRLHQERGEDSWILDLGSLWDVFVGVKSRSYHNAMTPDVLRRNQP